MSCCASSCIHRSTIRAVPHGLFCCSASLSPHLSHRLSLTSWISVPVPAPLWLWSIFFVGTTLICVRWCSFARCGGVSAEQRAARARSSVELASAFPPAPHTLDRSSSQTAVPQTSNKHVRSTLRVGGRQWCDGMGSACDFDNTVSHRSVSFSALSTAPRCMQGRRR